MRERQDKDMQMQQLAHQQQMKFLHQEEKMEASAGTEECNVVETGYPQITLKTVSSLSIYLQEHKEMKIKEKYVQFSHSQVLTLTLLHSIFYKTKINILSFLQTPITKTSIH
jgi:hypothetical protein